MATCTYNPGINSVNPYVTLKVTQESINVSLNQSTIRWELTLYRPSAISSSGSKNYSVTIDNQTHTGTTTIGGSGTKVIASDTQLVKHNSDGTKTISFSLSLQFDISWSGKQIYTGTASGSMALSPIAQATTPQLSKTNFKLGESVEITLPAASTSYKHELMFTFAGRSYELMGSNLSGSTTYTFQKNLANQIPNALTGAGKIQCTTYNDTTVIGTTYVDFTAQVSDDAVPSVSILGFSNGDSEISDKFGTTLLIKNKSKISVVTSLVGSYGSTIKKRVAKFLGVNYSGSSNTINIGYSDQAGSIPCTVTVTDSRGRTTTATKNVTITDYTPPQIISFLVERYGSDGAANDNGTYAYASCNFTIDTLSDKNDKTYTIEYRSTDVTEWTQVASGSVYTLNDKVNCGNILNVDKAYLFRLTVSDYFSSTSVDASVSTAFTLVDYHSTGRGIAFGKVAEAADLMDVALPMRVHRFDTPVINSGSINDLVYSGCWYLAAGVTDKPGNQNGYLTVTRYNASYIYQRFVSYAGRVWERIMASGTWQDWCGTYTENGWIIQKQMDGTFILEGSYKGSLNFGDAWFQRWRKKSVSVAFPYTFASAPVVSLATAAYDGSDSTYLCTAPIVYPKSVTASNVTIEAQTDTNNIGMSVSLTIAIRAVGRWK